MTSKDRESLRTVCRERDIYKAALEVIAATDRLKWVRSQIVSQ